MKKVHIADTPAEAHFMKGLLEREGIHCRVENENLVAAFGEVPPTIDTMPSVVVLKEADIPKAQQIVDNFIKARRWRPDGDLKEEGPVAASIIILAFIVIAIVSGVVVLLSSAK
jgi:cytochrome b subunit of formate dehydrogenase